MSWKRFETQSLSSFKLANTARKAAIKELRAGGCKVDTGQRNVIKNSSHKVRVKRRADGTFDLIVWVRNTPAGKCEKS